MFFEASGFCPRGVPTPDWPRRCAAAAPPPLVAPSHASLSPLPASTYNNSLGSGFRVYGLWFRVYGLGFRV